MSFSLGSVPLSEFESVLEQLTWWTGGIQYVACDKFEKLSSGNEVRDTKSNWKSEKTRMFS